MLYIESLSFFKYIVIRTCIKFRINNTKIKIHEIKFLITSLSFVSIYLFLGSVAKLKLYAHLYKTIKVNIVLTVKSFVSINY